MTDICSIDCLPALLSTGGTRGWNASCSLGLIAAGYAAWFLVLAAPPGLVLLGFLGWRWMGIRQRRVAFLLLAPSTLLVGLGSLHHDLGWLLLGVLAVTSIVLLEHRSGRGRTRPHGW